MITRVLRFKTKQVTGPGLPLRVSAMSSYNMQGPADPNLRHSEIEGAQPPRPNSAHALTLTQTLTHMI